MDSIVIYLLVISCTFFCANLAEKRIKLKGKLDLYSLFFSFMSIFIPSIVAGMRFYVGTDYHMYVNAIFKNIAHNNSMFMTHLEWGYTTLNFVISRFTDNEHVMLFIVSFITTFFVYLALYNYRKYTSISMGMLIYMFLYYQTSFNLMRQYLALSIVLYAFTLILNGRYKKSIIYIMLATTFHYSAIISLSLIGLYKVNFSKKSIIYYTLIAVSLISCFAFYEQIMSIGFYFMGIFIEIDRYQRYIIDVNAGEFSLMITFLRLPVILLSFLFFKSLYTYNKDNRLLIYLLIIDLILSHLAIKSDYMQRIALYFALPKLLLLPQLFNCLKIESNKLYITIYLNGYLFFYWMYYYYYCNYSQTFPYNVV